MTNLIVWSVGQRCDNFEWNRMFVMIGVSPRCACPTTVDRTKTLPSVINQDGWMRQAKDTVDRFNEHFSIERVMSWTVIFIWASMGTIVVVDMSMSFEVHPSIFEVICRCFVISNGSTIKQERFSLISLSTIPMLNSSPQWHWSSRSWPPVDFIHQLVSNPFNSMVLFFSPLSFLFHLSSI